MMTETDVTATYLPDEHCLSDHLLPCEMSNSVRGDHGPLLLDLHTALVTTTLVRALPLGTRIGIAVLDFPHRESKQG